MTGNRSGTRGSSAEACPLTILGDTPQGKNAAQLASKMWFHLIDRGHDVSVHTAQRFVHTQEANDPYQGSHSGNVSYYALSMAGALGCTATVQQHVALAAELHDVGRVSVPQSILSKRGQLTPQEYEQVMTHTLVSAHFLKPVLGHDPMVLGAARWHHEHPDGTGPSALSGNQIPLVARIVCVADAYDAMMHDRPYRPALPSAKALDELRSSMGKKFDRACVDVLIQLAGSGELKRSRHT